LGQYGALIRGIEHGRRWPRHARIRCPCLTACGPYLDGAPGAVQVADRFHLLQNLAETLEVVFADHAGNLRAAEQARRDAVAAERGTVSIPPAQPQARARVLAAERRDRRTTVHEQVWELRSQGWSGRVIARHLGISRATVFRNLRSEVFPERKSRRGTGRSLLDPLSTLLTSLRGSLRDGSMSCSSTGTTVTVMAASCSALCRRMAIGAAIPRSRAISSACARHKEPCQCAGH